jgi:uncharacterized protein (DUF433 family)
VVVAVSSHILLDERGIAWIGDTGVKVLQVARDKLAHGFSAEVMHFQYPHLSLAQIYAALSYYHDHQSDVDAQITAADRLAESLRHQLGDCEVRAKL